MARGKKTGGRNFKKGHGKGRPKGAKDKVPRSFKASIRVLYQQLAADRPDLFENAVVKGLSAKPPFSFQYLQMGAHYIDGKPADTLKIIPLSKLSDETLAAIKRDLGAEADA